MRLLYIALLVFLSAPVKADVEVITLRYRTVEQVLPVLRPLLEPGGGLSGMNNQLIVRASAGNIADIRRVLASIDTMPRRLIISVRHDAQNARASVGASVSGGVYSGSRGTRAEVDVRASSTQRAGDERVSQTVQVMEGSPASIQIGQSIPVSGRVVTRTAGGGVVITDTLSYRDVGTGFQVVPRLSGDRVTLEISPYRDRPGERGAVNVQQAATTVNGRLGEWIELGGFDASESRSGFGVLSGGTSQRSDRRSAWVKVEELK